MILGRRRASLFFVNSVNRFWTAEITESVINYRSFNNGTAPG